MWLKPGIIAASNAPSYPAATISGMTQFAAANQIFQRDTVTGGGQGKGQARLSVPVTVSADGAIYARVRAEDGTTVVQSPFLITSTATTSTTSVTVPVDARLGWSYVDLSGDGVTWSSPLLGTTQIGVGDGHLITGQSLASVFHRISGTTLSAAGLSATDITNLAYCRIFCTAEDYSASSISSVVWEQPGGTNHPGPGAAYYLSKMAQISQINQFFAGHTVAGASQESWQPVSNSSNIQQLNRVIGATGGKYRYELWWQGQGDADCKVLSKYYQHDMNFRTYGVHTGVGTQGSGGYADLNTYTEGSLNSRTGAVRRLVSTINNMSIGPYYYGPMWWSNEVRSGGVNWCATAPNAYYVHMEGLQTGGVHPTAVGTVEAARCWVRGAIGENEGPKLVSAQRDPSNPNDIIATLSFTGNLVLTGNWYTRFVAYVAGSTFNKWPIVSGNQTNVASNQVRLTLTGSPTQGDAFDLWLGPAYDGDPNGDMSGDMIRDDRDPEGFGNGRTFQFTTAPITVAALNTGVAKTANGSLPNTYIAPTSVYDMTLTSPVYDTVEHQAGFGHPLIGGTAAVPNITIGGQNSVLGSSSYIQTVVMRVKMPAIAPVGNVYVFRRGNTNGIQLIMAKTSRRISVTMSGVAVSMSNDPTPGKVYWLAATMVGNQIYYYYANVTDGGPVTRVISGAATKLYSSVNGVVDVSGNASGNHLFDNGDASVFDIGVYSAAIYTDVPANIIVPTTPLTGNEANIEDVWPMTSENDNSTNTQKNLVRAV